MAYNLDLKDGKVAIELFERVLNLDPEHERANYLYGIFLSGTFLQDKAIPYLEKSIKNGYLLAKFRLALVYTGNPKTLDKSKAMLKEYLKEAPNDTDAAIALKAIEAGNISYEYQY